MQGSGSAAERSYGKKNKNWIGSQKFLFLILFESYKVFSAFVKFVNYVFY